MRRSLGGLLAALAIAGASVAACGSDDSGEPSTNEKPDAAAQGFPRTVKHAMGDAQIKKAPSRVIALDQAFVETTIALDTAVVGYTTFTAKDQGIPAYMGEAGKKYGAEAKSVGLLEEPKAEKIAAARPDLIMSAKVRHEAGYKQLTQLGVPVVFSDNVGVNWKDNLRLTGKALGKEQLAEQRISAYESRAKKIGEAIKKKAGKNPTVSVVRFAGEPTTRFYTRASYIGVILDDVGLAKPKKQPTGKDISADISEERILDVEADHIFVSTYDDGTGAAAKVQKKFQANPLWKKLKGELHTVDDNIWLTAVGIFGANAVLDELAKTFGVDPAR